MARIIPADGNQPCDLLILGERPGAIEYEQRQNFVGPAGDELWDRIWRLLKLERDSFRVVNTVPIFSVKPPTPAEITAYAHVLDWELRHTKPRFILTVGYHAARALLPQFRDRTGDYFHGLAFPCSRVVRGWDAAQTLVVPACHSSAALREPDLYQNQFTQDIRAFGRAIHGKQLAHVERTPIPYRCGLAGFGQEGQRVGVDTEYGNGQLQCVTVAKKLKEVVCQEVWNHAPSPFLKPALLHSKIVSHYAMAEWRSLLQIGLDLADCLTVDDTMLQAYVLGLPQSLKVLMYRLKGYRMHEYDDLVRPIDRELVTNTLREFYETEVHKAEALAARAARSKKANRAGSRTRRTAWGHRRSSSDSQVPRTEGRGSDSQSGASKRALSSIKRIITTDAEKTKRKRWEASKFAPLLVLPPPPTWKDVPESIRLPYAMTDAVAHIEAFELQAPMIKARGLQRIYEINKGVLPFLARNERVGMAVDTEEIPRLSKKFADDYQGVLDELEQIAGHPVNPNAHEDVSQTLFDELGVRPTKRTKTGFWTTGKKYLKAREFEHKAVALILEARHLGKLRSTYVDRLPSLLTEHRYHPHWKYTRTATGRPAEEIILLIPKHSKRAKFVRNLFYATPGHRLIANDLGQIEMRVMAHESRDTRMLKAFERGEDFHAATAYTMLGAPKKKEDQDESRHRLPAKTLNFGILMGLTEFGLLEQLHSHKLFDWDIEKCIEFRRDWFKYYKGVYQWVEEKKAEARARGYVTDMWGWRRDISAIWSTEESIVRRAEREAHATPIQSGAIGIAKIWIKRVWKHVIQPLQREDKFYCEPWVWVHDDITLEVDKRIARTTQRRVLELVPDALCIPTTADGKIGRRWGALHDAA